MYRAYVSFDFFYILLKYRETTYFLLNSYRVIDIVCVYILPKYFVFGIRYLHITYSNLYLSLGKVRPIFVLLLVIVMPACLLSARCLPAVPKSTSTW